MTLESAARPPADWSDWVSATALRNHVLSDPLLDWLDLYGSSRGFTPDTRAPGYDPRTDFSTFVLGQGRRFEEGIVAHLKTFATVIHVPRSEDGVRDVERVSDTHQAMVEGSHVIHGGVLWDPDHRAYGSPDLLIRSDVLLDLFPGVLTEADAAITAPDLGAPWHYRVVDVKFTTLHLAANGDLANEGSAPVYKAQLFVYNRALGILQGYEPPLSYLLGRSWEQRGARGTGAVERLAPVPQNGAVANRVPIADVVEAAADWIRRLRSHGGNWELLPVPSAPELWPHVGNTEDAPWHGVKRVIADELRELTQLWQVSVPGRRKAHAHGLLRWDDPGVTPDLVGVTGPTYSATLQALLDVNRTTDGAPVRPERVTTAEDEWRPEPVVEFYVDFETVSDLADDLTRLPQRGGQPLVFMIGCGHLESEEWVFQQFIAKALTEDAESAIIEQWNDHMVQVQRTLAPEQAAPLVVHWSSAETSTYLSAYNSAVARHGEEDWQDLRWFDFLSEVMRKEPVVVRGSLAFGLKSVARALHRHGLIETVWGDGPADGLGAMVGAWWAYAEALQAGRPVVEIDLMQEIAKYNEVDCRTMQEIVAYLRAHH